MSCCWLQRFCLPSWPPRPPSNEIRMSFWTESTRVGGGRKKCMGPEEWSKVGGKRFSGNIMLLSHREVICTEWSEKKLRGFPSGDRNMFVYVCVCTCVCMSVHAGRSEALFRLKQVKKMAFICPCCVCTEGSVCMSTLCMPVRIPHLCVCGISKSRKRSLNSVGNWNWMTDTQSHLLFWNTI